MGKGRGKRSVLAQKAQTIEEIWESVSRTKSADLNPPPSKIVLTPRSAEACLRHGLNPEILRIRPLDSFDVKGVDPTVQRLRHETYTQRRFEMMRLVRAERKRLVAQEARDADLAASGGGGGATITPQQLIAAQAKQNATFIEEEEKRMRKMQARYCIRRPFALSRHRRDSSPSEKALGGFFPDFRRVSGHRDFRAGKTRSSSR